MMKIKHLIGALCAAALLAFAGAPANAGELKLVVDHLRSTQGQLIVALYSTDTKDAFPKHPDQALKKILVPLHDGPQSIQFDKLPEGRFAVSIVHDENGNGTMDHNFFGMPKEGFGFSNNPKVRFSLLSFDEASFQVQNDVEVHISMSYW